MRHEADTRLCIVIRASSLETSAFMQADYAVCSIHAKHSANSRRVILKSFTISAINRVYKQRNIPQSATDVVTCLTAYHGSRLFTSNKGYCSRPVKNADIFPATCLLGGILSRDILFSGWRFIRDSALRSVSRITGSYKARSKREVASSRDRRRLTT